MMRRLLMVLSLVFGAVAVQAATLPTLPTPIDPAILPMPTITGTTTTATCATLQTVLNSVATTSNANPTLNYQVTITPANAVCLGPFFLPAHNSGTGWIVITGPNGGVQPPGTRVGSADAASMPTLQYNQTSQHTAMTTQPNAQRYRFVGVVFTGNAAFAPNFRYVCIGLLSDGCGADNTGNIIFDRVVCQDAQNPYNTVRCLQLDSQVGNIAVIDSFCWHIALSGASTNDAQCFQVDKGPGPYLIRNNYLSSAGEDMMAGGGEEGTATIPPVSNITIQYNDFDLPPEFRAGSIYTGQKALLEFKTGTRILVEGNRFTNKDYVGEGFAMRLTVRNSTGTSVNSTISDLTVRYNKFANNTNGFLVLPADVAGGGGSSGPTKHAQRWWIHDNLMYGFGWICGGGGRCAVPLLFSGSDGATLPCTDAPACYMEDFTFSHNTMDMGGSASSPINVTEISRNNKNLDYRDNLINVNNGYGFYATTDFGPQGWGTNALNLTWNATWNWQNNALAFIGAGDNFPYPANGSLYPANAYSGTGNYQWVNPCSVSGGCNGTFDYTIPTSSPAHNAASDGTDMGVNFVAYNLCQAGNCGGGGDVTAPTNPSGAVAAPPGQPQGQTQMTVSWTASSDPDSPTITYFVERCQGNGCSGFVPLTSTNLTTMTDTGLTAATTYVYRIRAGDPSNNLSGYSNSATGTTLPLSTPAAPSQMRVTEAF